MSGLIGIHAHLIRYIFYEERKREKRTEKERKKERTYLDASLCIDEEEKIGCVVLLHRVRWDMVHRFDGMVG